MRNIGKKIKTVREQQNISMSKMASEMDVSKGYLHKVENNTPNISISMLKRIAEYLSTPVSYFIEDWTPSDFELYLLMRELKYRGIKNHEIKEFMDSHSNEQCSKCSTQ